MTGTDTAAELSAIGADDLRLLLLIRHFEEALLALFESGRITGTTHTSIGQEYVPVALSPLLDAGDTVLSNHRGHAHYLARHPDPEALLAEILGRAGGLCAGVGGSQHLHRPGFFSTGVQGESLPVAVGMALHTRRVAPQGLVLVYIGDGTWGEGAVYEALNMAALWAVPLVVVVENNGIAQSTPLHAHMAGTVAGRAAAFGLQHREVTAQEPGRIRRQVAPVLRAVRDGGGPAVIEFRTARIGPHSKGDDPRSARELATLRDGDWYTRYERCHDERFGALDAEQRARVADVVGRVLAAPLSEWQPGRTPAPHLAGHGGSQ
ncbi:thiamine pyrophosphate-dependent dehydrogenase E1 component subunit alpha [Streptomyces sp. NBC_01431]|uniref:thiamine pyrophosphate-dependent dehydrogenase E1 component subunit alpha n=1 Tax=Streptomyces sp. NBC_01431 TaxID=2903863 RepID=UPI002E34A444|nr:thiamine pyrophosphate-dependent dehydrogenase E1 component subunit alpha [Streptomyces sp. NBC_01431]